MKLWQWILFCVTFFIIFVIAYTPANIIYRFIPPASGVEVANLSGSLFDGRAETASFNGIRLNRISWSLSPLHLLTGRLKMHIKGGNLRDQSAVYVDGQISLNLISLKRFNVQNFTAYIPTQSLLAQFKLPVIVDVQGRIKLDLKAFSTDGSCLELAGNGQWSNAVVTVQNQTITFGDFDASLECFDDGYAMQISGDNRLNLNAEVVVYPNGNFQPSGTFAMDPTLPDMIKQAGVFFGEADANGVYTIFE